MHRFVKETIILPLLVLAALAGCKKANHPPSVGTPTGPDSAQVGVACTFTATATDPDGDRVALRFDWGDGDSSNWTSLVSTGTPVSVTHAWTSPGTFRVTAQAKDEQDAYSAWSQPCSTTVVAAGNRPPNTPAIPTGPSSGWIDSLYAFTTITTDPDGDGICYRFDWGDGDTSNWIAWVPSGTPGTMTNGWQSVGDFPVRSQAKDVNGGLSNWSSPLSVRIAACPGTLKWRYQTGDGVFSSPAIGSDGTVYVGSEDDYLYAVNSDGTLKWRYPTGDCVDASPAIAADGTVYVGSFDDYLYAINPNGTFKWRYQTGDNVNASPAIAADGTVYVGSNDSCLYALNPDGTLKWRYQTGLYVFSSPAIGSDGTVYVGSCDDYLYAINPNGTFKWRYQTGGIGYSSPAIAADGTVYVGSEDGYLYAVNSGGTLKWRCQAGVSVDASPAVAADGTVYVGSLDDYLYAINPDGTPKWRYQTGGFYCSSSATAADGTVYVGADGIYAINPDGTLKWRYETGDRVDASPAVGSDGTVYVGSGYGYLYAITGSAPLASAAWPKFHHDNRNTGRVGGGRQ